MLRDGNGRVSSTEEEGKHPVGRGERDKNGRPSWRQRREVGRRETKEAGGRQGTRVASFLHNLARQPREKLVLPRARATEVQKDSRERDGAGVARGGSGTLSNIL